MKPLDFKAPDHDNPTGVVVRCPACTKEFALYYDEYHDRTGVTLKVAACLSAGVYSIDVVCPHCKHEETIL